MWFLDREAKEKKDSLDRQHNVIGKNDSHKDDKMKENWKELRELLQHTRSFGLGVDLICSNNCW